MLLWGVLWIWYYTGCLEYDLVLLNETSSISMFIVISVLIGAMGKSAQILFHVWLADAMEGPTPVSALIHAATLVTAGIYLMVRLGPFMAGSDLVILVGCLTAFMAGVFGFFQADLKRVIAFSTCSQLGYTQKKTLNLYFNNLRAKNRLNGLFLLPAWVRAATGGSCSGRANEVVICPTICSKVPQGFILNTYLSNPSEARASFGARALKHNQGLCFSARIGYRQPLLECEAHKLLKAYALGTNPVSFAKSELQKDFWSSASPLESSLVALDYLEKFAYVEKWEDLSPVKRYEIKRDYSGKGVIYLFQNKKNNKCYVGSTINFKSRLKNYFDTYYLNKNKDKMPICAALLLHGFDNFSLYVLEVLDSTHTNSKGVLVADRQLLLVREDYFAKLIKPSYNVADILNPFVGPNHPSFGVAKSQATKDKIRDTLTGRKQTEIEIENHLAHKP